MMLTTPHTLEISWTKRPDGDTGDDAYDGHCDFISGMITFQIKKNRKYYEGKANMQNVAIWLGGTLRDNKWVTFAGGDDPDRVKALCLTEANEVYCARHPSDTD